MDHQPLLTIAVPTYNGAGALPESLNSIISQISNWDEIELLISDNCSNDGSSDLLTEYGNSYPEMRIIRNSTNIGPDANFLQCYERATGQFVLLLSDDDILIEGALGDIMAFLRQNPDLSLIALNTYSFRDKYNGIENCTILEPNFEDGLVTYDKQRFMDSAIRNWGFLSSFIISRSRFIEIDNPQQFFETNWLQGYVNICCSDRDTDLLGTVGRPCIGSGVYGNVADLDTAKVDGVNFKEMLIYAVDHAGYDKGQLIKFYKYRIALLGRHAVIKERASGIKKTSAKLLFLATYKYPKIWFTLYPVFLVPPSVCRLGMRCYSLAKGYSREITINRDETLGQK